jgi:hypothetical protein
MTFKGKIGGQVGGELATFARPERHREVWRVTVMAEQSRAESVDVE